MEIKLPQIALVIYLALVSVLLKDIQFLPFALLVALALLDKFVIGNYVNAKKLNLLYLLIAFVPFPNILMLFLLYLPFAVFGLLFSKKSFLKSYILGFAVSLIPTTLIYIASNYFQLPLGFFTIFVVSYIPVMIALFIAHRKRNFDFIDLDSREYLIILAVLISAVFVAYGIVDGDSLFISNGTYYYTKFNLIVKSADTYGTFPIYDPSVSNGESPFLFETPLMFSHIAFASILLYFIPPVIFYNAYSFFILLISTLALSILIRSVLPVSERNSVSELAVVILGSSILGLHFHFVQLLESFKAFFMFPINYLIFAIILEKPSDPKEIFIVAYLIVLSFIIHAANGIGIVLLAFSLIALVVFDIYRKEGLIRIKNWLQRNKAIFAVIAVIFVLFPLFYVMPVFIFKDFLEDGKSGIEWGDAPRASLNYVTVFFLDYSYLSLEYPDARRNDDKKIGPFISVLGMLSLAAVFILYRSKSLYKARLFAGAFFLFLLLSSIIVNIPLVQEMQYSYRVEPTYFLILLVVSLCAVVASIGQRHVKFLLVLALLAAFLHMLPLAKANIENIHMETVIYGNNFSSEIAFLKSLPNDGRVITYGLFSNSVDYAMSSLTDKYFPRNLLTTNPRSRSIYEKIHGTHAWGMSEDLSAMSGTELSNYLRLGGFKYVFANGCDPVGEFVVKLLYPSYAYPIYQNQCLMFFAVNGANYVEKVSILKSIDSDIYRNEEGYKYYTLAPYYDFGEQPYSKAASEPEGLSFERKSPVEVIIYGSFEENDWVVFKEDYFSRWKAHMDGKEVPVLANNHNSVLIKTMKGDRIVLKYSVLQSERLFGLVSMASAAALLFLFMLLLMAAKPADY